jgi:hypothetical protein
MAMKLWRNKIPGNIDDDRDQNLLNNKRKSIKMMVTVVVLFGVCWLPWHIFTVLKLSWKPLSSSNLIKPIFFACHWLAMSNGCYNPFVYAIFSENFKKELKRKAVCESLRKRICCLVQQQHAEVPMDVLGQNDITIPIELE